MLTKNAPHFVKFVFTWIENDQNNCFSTSDIDELLKFKNSINNSTIDSLNIGDEITYNKISYRVDNISLDHIYDDLDLHNTGVDSNDCRYTNGENIPYLFKVRVNITKL